jgi:nitroimidazol reductase NimA-like FMN-containing flavoprotein (pyridoxamine 5'-phosphate oxidase superfamily)
LRVCSLDDAEIRAFLVEGTRTGKLGYRAAGGCPLVAPLWFVIEGGCLVFSTGKDTGNGRALARDPRIAVYAGLEQPLSRTFRSRGVAGL